jgi:hypothetical protein
VASEIYLDGWTFGSRRYPVDRVGAKMDPTDPNALLSIWKTLRETDDAGDGD